MKRNLYTPVSFGFLCVGFVALVMSQSVFMVLAFLGLLILVLFCAYLDYERDGQIERIYNDVKSQSELSAKRFAEVESRLQSLSASIGLKHLRSS